MKKFLVLTLTMALTLSFSGCAAEAEYKKGYEDAIKKMEAEHAEAYNTGYGYGFDAGYEVGLKDGDSAGYNRGLADGSPVTKKETIYVNAHSGYSSNQWGIEDSVYDDVYDYIYERAYEQGYNDARSELSDEYGIYLDY